MTRPFYTLTYEDIGKAAIHAFGKPWQTSNFIGRVLPQDVGKRVYQVGEILQVENNEQRQARLHRSSRESLLSRANDLLQTIKNDGDTYQRRLNAARMTNARLAANEWLTMTVDAARKFERQFEPADKFTVSDLLDTAHALALYYAEHIKEMD